MAASQNPLVPDALLDELGSIRYKEASREKLAVAAPTPAPADWRQLGHLLDSLQAAASTRPAHDPLAEPVEYRVCDHCGRPVVQQALDRHVKECLAMEREVKVAKEVVEEVKEEEVEVVKKKKVKREAPLALPAPVKKARPVKAAAKPKGPVDVERQCGVALPQGGFCARLLTCKTHLMGLKRAVPGRSAPYDQLLAAYQRRNQARVAQGVAAAQAAKDDMESAGVQVLDPDEETHQVMEGLGRNLAYPLERCTMVPVRSRSRFVRMREMFAGALLPRGGLNGIGSIHGRVGILDVDRPSEQQWVGVKGGQRQRPR